VLDREIILTPEGRRKLKDELEYLSTKKREEVAERIKDARGFGDISRTRSTTTPRTSRPWLSSGIYALEEKLGSAIVIDAKSVKTDTVGVGTKVTMQDMAKGDILQYAIVGSAEADPSSHKLSNESPVGQAIIGRKPGDKVTVAVPQGSMKFKILTIERA